MTRTGTPFPRIDRRCQARTVVIALMTSYRFGHPVYDSDAFESRSPGWCAACGTYFAAGTWVQYARYGAPNAAGVRRRGTVHATCPPFEYVLESLRERSDQRLITHVAPEGRQVATCGHDVDGQVLFLLHDDAVQALLGQGRWVCEECATK